MDVSLRGGGIKNALPRGGDRLISTILGFRETPCLLLRSEKEYPVSSRKYLQEKWKAVGNTSKIKMLTNVRRRCLLKWPV